MTDGQEKFFTYAAGVAGCRMSSGISSPQAYYYYGPFWLLGEYTVSDQGELATAKAKLECLEHRLAGHDGLRFHRGGSPAPIPASYFSAHPFDPWAAAAGAPSRLVGRFGQLNVDKDVFPAFATPGSVARGPDSFSIGLNWYWNNNIRFNVDYSRTTFGGIDGASSSILVTKGNENAVMSRVQLAF